MAVIAKKILVAYDDEGIRGIILILKSDGYTVTGLDNGHKVLQTIQDDRPDVLLLDVCLGDMDGRNICKALKLVSSDPGDSRDYRFGHPRMAYQA